MAFFAAVACNNLFAQNSFTDNLKKGRHQTVVVYGSSVALQKTSGLWVQEIRNACDAKFPGLVTLFNAGMAGVSSYWATETFSDSVLSKKPDVLIFGFAENDAVARFGYQPWYSGRCAAYMIDRLRKQNPGALIIMYIVTEKALGNAAATRNGLKDYNDSYRTTAVSKNVKLIDCSAFFLKIYAAKGEDELKKYQPDGICFTKHAAVKVFAPLVIQELGL
jgi:hypothetical protein